MDDDEIEHKFWIVLAPLCAMRYINDPKYLSGDTTLEGERLKKLKTFNVHIAQAISQSAPKEFSSILSLCVQALRHIAPSGELLVYYGKKYKLHR